MEYLFGKYDKSTFSCLRQQHNIMVLVGNGFDMAVLKEYKEGRMKGKTTSYQDFFEYITYYHLSDDNNVLYKKMKEDKNLGRSNWSDFENSLQEMVNEGTVSIDVLEKCVDEFQEYFTRFLNEIVDSDVLLKLNTDARKNQWANQSMAYFLEDILYPGLEFSSKTDHYDLFNYVFANFNYTYLLDNYIYLDKVQFDPHYWPSADRNFQFYLNTAANPRGITSWSSYVLCDVIHPHGTQNVPRSMLFGIDMPQYDKGRSLEKRLIKSYWSQYDIKYKPYMEEADLFIIFGMSFGKTDAWWFDEIYDSLLNRNAELLIYMYGDKCDDEVKQSFINACVRHQDDSKANKEKIENRICVKTFVKNDTNFLGFKKKLT